jgi:hypothetical protein
MKRNGRMSMTFHKHMKTWKQQCQKYPNSFRSGTRIVSVSTPLNLTTSAANTSRLSYICWKYKLVSLTLSAITQAQSITGKQSMNSYILNLLSKSLLRLEYPRALSWSCVIGTNKNINKYRTVYVSALLQMFFQTGSSCQSEFSSCIN